MGDRRHHAFAHSNSFLTLSRPQVVESGVHAWVSRLIGKGVPAVLAGRGADVLAATGMIKTALEGTAVYFWPIDIFIPGYRPQSADPYKFEASKMTIATTARMTFPVCATLSAFCRTYACDACGVTTECIGNEKHVELAMVSYIRKVLVMPVLCSDPSGVDQRPQQLLQPPASGGSRRTAPGIWSP